MKSNRPQSIDWEIGSPGADYANPRAALSRSLEDVPPEYAEGVERRLADLETPPAAPSWAPFLASDGPGFVPWLG